jgi:hypothetical protein
MLPKRGIGTASRAGSHDQYSCNVYGVDTMRINLVPVLLATILNAAPTLAGTVDEENPTNLLTTLGWIGLATLAGYFAWGVIKWWRVQLAEAKRETEFRKYLLDTNPDWVFIHLGITRDFITLEQAAAIVLRLTTGMADYEPDVEPMLIEGLKALGQIPEDYEIPEEIRRKRVEQRRAESADED